METTALCRRIVRSVAFAGALVMALTGRAEPRNYTLHSRAAGQIFGFPVINNEGVVAFLGVVTNPDTSSIKGVVFKNDGTGNVAFFNFSTGGLNFPLGSIDLNDSGAVGIQGASVAPRGILGRIEPDGSFTPLAEADPLGSAPFREFEPHPSINNSGQLAALAINTDRTFSILRFDNSGITEIARTTATFFNFTTPTVNDFGVVAFKAQEPDIFVSPFTGSGGPLTNEAPGWGASSARSPIINNSGVLLVDGGDGEPLLFTAKGGVITPVVNGDEAPIFQTLDSRISMNNSCNVAFVSQERTFQPSIPSALGQGLFTGNDPIADKVIATGEIVFGEEVVNIYLSPHAINDRGQITFLIQTANPNIGPWFHVVRADPLEPLPQFCDPGPGGTQKVGFLIIDEDSIDNGIKSIENISFGSPHCGAGSPAVCINDDIANPGVRTFLFTRGNDMTPFSGLVLPTGKVGDQGLFTFTNPDPQVSLQNGAAFTTAEFIAANGAAADENNLDKVDGVVPLGEADITALEGKTVCAVVYDSDISVDVAAGFGNLKGATLGLTAFKVTAVGPDPDGPAGSVLPSIAVDLLPSSDVKKVCESAAPL